MLTSLFYVTGECYRFLHRETAGYYTVVFAIARVWRPTQATSSFETEDVSRGTFLYLGEGTAHVNRVATPPGTK